MKRFALLALLATLALALPARACLNDRDSDSLATQAAQLPETLRVITGRFERNPPLYYQMRIERERAALQRNPKQFGLYDDIGVAFDKLGRHDEALQTMKAKRENLPAFDAQDKANREAWYRTFANEGTFRVHRYLKGGAPVEKWAEMEKARAQIKRAIEIKPDAHFGRERYQLMAMDWIIAREYKETKKTLGEWMAGRDGWTEVDNVETLKNSARGRAVEGLSGLIVLGGAWESPDVFEALGAALETKDGVTLRYLALSRALELLEKHKSLGDLKTESLNYSRQRGELDDWGVAVNGTNQKSLDKLWGQLRAEADGWNDERQNWMVAKLRTGAHPDTDANFWDGYTKTSPPSLEIDWFDQGQHTAKIISGWLIGAALLFVGVPVALLFLWFRRRQGKAQQNAREI